MVTKGHGAVLAAIEMGMELIPVEFQDYENRHQELADLSMDNQLAKQSQSDTAKARELLSELPPDFDTRATGYTDEEIDAITNSQDVAIVSKEIRPSPKMAWALIGIPIQKFGSVQQVLDSLPEEAIVHVTSSDKTK